MTYFDTYLAALDTLDDPQVLGNEWVIHPPTPDYGYDATPQNALTFATMGVDGVHYAILTKGDKVLDNSPVISVYPMEGEYSVLAHSFLRFLADACGVSVDEMESVFELERSGQSILATFLRQHFDMYRETDADARLERAEELEPLLGSWLVPKPTRRNK